MRTESQSADATRFARCIAASKRVRWDIHQDVIRGRSFDRNHKYLPDGLSRVRDLDFLTPDDARYFAETCGRTLTARERAGLEAGILGAYRWQYILSGAEHPHFQEVLAELTTPEQAARIAAALGTLH